MKKKPNIDKEALYNYYIREDHGYYETIKYFKVSETIFLRSLKAYGFKKDKSNTSKKVHANRTAEKKQQIIDKIKNNWKNKSAEEIQSFVVKNLNTRIKNHGSASYRNWDKHRQTCEERYGDPGFTNREKAAKTFQENIEKGKTFGSNSRNEKLLFDYFKNSDDIYFRNVEPQKFFNDCVLKAPLRFDFYFRPLDEKIGDLSVHRPELIIEYDGQQHYYPVCFNGNSASIAYKQFIQTQCHDWYKEYYCFTHNINLLRLKYLQLNRQHPDPRKLLQNSENTLINRKSLIRVHDINYCDFINYSQPTFTIYSGISCTFKCEKECGTDCCQNHACIGNNIKSMDINAIIKEFNTQTLATSICFQGLEPLDNLRELLWFIYEFRLTNNNNIVIYTGYTEAECESLIYLVSEKMHWKNIMVKFGRFIPNQKPHLDSLLGVELASDNQYARWVSEDHC